VFQRLHVDGTANVLRAAREAGVGRVVHVSSPGVLGPVPNGPADEDAPYHPTNAYERSKAAAERAALALSSQIGLPLVVVRPEFVYGPGDRHVLRLLQAIARSRFFYIGDGGALCHPTYVDDASRGIVDAGERGAAGRIYHFAGPRAVTIRELAETFARAMGAPPPRVRLPRALVHGLALALDEVTRGTRLRPPLTMSAYDFFTMDRQFSWARARSELGWSPEVELLDGAARAVRWYRERKMLS
jgi:nucleoside-diphosphate-sugar epimerase